MSYFLQVHHFLDTLTLTLLDPKMLLYFVVFCIIFLYVFIYAYHFLFGDVIRSYYDTWVELSIFGLTGNIDGGMVSPSESDSSIYPAVLVMYIAFTFWFVITLLNTLIAIMAKEWDSAMEKDLYSDFINERLHDYVSDRHNGESTYHSTCPQFKKTNAEGFTKINGCGCCSWICLLSVFVVVSLGSFFAAYGLYHESACIACWNGEV